MQAVTRIQKPDGFNLGAALRELYDGTKITDPADAADWIFKRIPVEERGDVLMEYVLLTLVIILPLVGVSVGLVNVSGETFSQGDAVAGDNFGLLGNAFVSRYRMVMSGISLPLP